MHIELFDQPKVHGEYLQVGTYSSHPIYVGERPPKDWVAMSTDNGKGVCINSSAYSALKKSLKFIIYLENICEHEISNDIVHEHNGEKSELDSEIIKYLKNQKVLESD